MIDIRNIFKRPGEGLKIISNKRLDRSLTSPRFYDQLFIEFEKMGYPVGYKFERGADAAIIIESAPRHLDELVKLKKRGTRIIQRIDGIMGNPGGQKAEHPKNRDIARIYAIADAVIFQSEFCKRVWERHFKQIQTRAKSYIILNGADDRHFAREGPGLDNFGAKHIIVTAARWRMWKNLEQMVEVMDRLERDDCVLLVAGDLEMVKEIHHPCVRYMGNLSHKELGKLFRSADAFLYLAWYDWCPKAVSQALLAGLPVICSTRGGTRELVQDCGIVVPSTDEDNLDDFDNPVPVDSAAALEAVKRILEDSSKYTRPRPDLAMSVCAGKYLQVIQEVTGNPGQHRVNKMQPKDENL